MSESYPSHVSYEYLDCSYESFAYRIVSLIGSNDILITSDYGLAAVVMMKTIVLHRNGKRYTIEMMNRYLQGRPHFIHRPQEDSCVFDGVSSDRFNHELVRCIQKQLHNRPYNIRKESSIMD